MREIRMSGLTRGEGVDCLGTRTLGRNSNQSTNPPLLYWSIIWKKTGGITYLTAMRLLHEFIGNNSSNLAEYRIQNIDAFDHEIH